MELLAGERSRAPMSDEQLLVQYAASGRHELLAELFARWHKPLLRILSRYYQSEICDDAVQEAFVAIQKRAGQFRAEAKASTWIIQIARNKAFDAVRTRHSSEVTGPAAQQIISGKPASPPGDDNSEQLAVLPLFVGRLPAKLRDVVLLADLAELPYAEVARRLSIPLGSVRSRRHHAIQRLRRMMTPEP
jgi:RNA polymerase sigma-70 factor (ECF subfamily)